MPQQEITELWRSVNELRDQTHSLEVTIRERLTAIETTLKPLVEDKQERQRENRTGWKSFLWGLAAFVTAGVLTALGIVKSSGG